MFEDIAPATKPVYFLGAWEIDGLDGACDGFLFLKGHISGKGTLHRSSPVVAVHEDRFETMNSVYQVGPKGKTQDLTAVKYALRGWTFKVPVPSPS